MSDSEKTGRLSPVPLVLDTERKIRRGLLQHGSKWFHLSQRGMTVKLRELDETSELLDALVFRLDEPEGRASFNAFVGSPYYDGWSQKEAQKRDEILAADPRTPRIGEPTRIVPVTALRHFYESLRSFGNDAVWRGLLDACIRHPGDLAALFAESCEHFKLYDNRDEDFGDRDVEKRDRRFERVEDHEQFATRIVASLLASREWSGDPELAFTYVTREISPLRTTGSRYNDGRTARSSGAGGMDLLLRSNDGFPIVGEIKAADDTNLFVALIQALTYASELATASQRARLANNYGFTEDWLRINGPSLDVFLIYEVGTDDTIKKKTVELVERLRRSRVAGVVRRIAILRCNTQGDATHLEREAVIRLQE